MPKLYIWLRQAIVHGVGRLDMAKEYSLLPRGHLLLEAIIGLLLLGTTLSLLGPLAHRLAVERVRLSKKYYALNYANNILELYTSCLAFNPQPMNDPQISKLPLLPPDYLPHARIETWSVAHDDSMAVHIRIGWLEPEGATQSVNLMTFLMKRPTP